MKRVAIDWDGTLVENRWPEMGDWRQGAVDFVANLLDCGVAVTVYTARLNPYYADGTAKPIDVQLNDKTTIRRMLDDQGFAAVDIFDHPKPHCDVFVDDRAIWCPPSNTALRAMTVRVLSRLGILDPS